MLEIKGREIYKIRPVAHLQNKPYDVVEGHPFHGQTYNTYTFQGKTFNVNSNDEFVQWRNTGILFSAEFVETSYEKEVDGELKVIASLVMQSCTNKEDEISMARTEGLLSKIYRDAEVTEVDADLMSEFIKD